MYAIRENGLMLSTNGIEDFAGDEKSLSEILADEDKAYMIIALPKHVGDTKKKRKKWLVDHAIQKYSEDNKTSISYLPLFLQAGFYSPNDKAF